MNDDDIALDELFAAARDQQPPAGAAARGWARFEAALGGPGGPPPGLAAPATLGWLGLAAKLGAAAAVLAVGVALGWPDDRPREPRAAAAPPPTTSPIADPKPAAPESTPDSSVAPDPAPQSAPPRLGTRSQPTATARASTPRPAAKPEPAVPSSEPVLTPEVVVVQRPTAPPAEPADSLRLEAELLGRAWVAIRERRAHDTRALLAEHARRFPEGALVPERRACQLVASCIAGDRDAIDRARRYLDEHRTSHLADRVAAGCGLRTPQASDPEAAAMEGLERPASP